MQRVSVCSKAFKIIPDTYKNRRKRFGLRFNVSAAIYNIELVQINFERGLMNPLSLRGVKIRSSVGSRILCP